MKKQLEFEDVDLGFDPEMAYKKTPVYDYKLMGEYVKEKNKKWSELTADEVEKFRSHD